jgi:hypothetical protein
MTPIIATCRLCLRERRLRLSHIIPEFLYRPLYGHTHEIRSVHPNLTRVRFLKKGLREPLLCNDCEGVIGKYEAYFAGAWYGVDGLPPEIPAGVNIIVMSGLNYFQFKLLHLSILWRASVSILQEFRAVDLGPHQERIRAMILEGNAGEAGEYKLAASVLLRANSREVHGGIIAVPQRIRHADGWMYSSIYGGCIGTAS